MNSVTDGGAEALAELLGQVLQRHAREIGSKKVQWSVKQTKDGKTWFGGKRKAAS